MGADIHMIVQVKEDSKWKSLSKGYDDRNYNAFAILANVRNGYGFAGCVTSTGFDFISEARGLPDDFNIENEDHHSDVKSDYSDGGFWMGDHSFSWVTLQELIDVDWDKRVVKFGVVSEKYYLELAEKNTDPEEWSGGVGGGKTITFEEAVYTEMKQGDTLPEDREIYVRMKWYSTYKESVGSFYEFVKKMEELSKKYSGVDNVRLVFGFDS